VQSRRSRRPVRTAVRARQDLDGTPDLIVDGKRLPRRGSSTTGAEGVVRSLQEGGTTPGFHRVLRLTVTTLIFGDADIFIGDPITHWDPNGDGDPRDSDGCTSCPRATITSTSATTRRTSSYPQIESHVALAKHGFCMIDVTP